MGIRYSTRLTFDSNIKIKHTMMEKTVNVLKGVISKTGCQHKQHHQIFIINMAV